MGVLLGIYLLLMFFVLVYSLTQLNLARLYLKKKRNQQPTPPLTEYPTVTIQLPIYNELYVVERLIDNVSKLDYPKDKLEVQVLDDSTDETKEIIARKVAEHTSKGLDIKQILRPDRVGYKAGALAYGMDLAKGEFIAIFDADFLPEPDFLKKTLAEFTHDKVGMVQTKWQHINEDYSLLTRLQAFGLDAHFTIEQAGRNSRGYFMNFNGTAGVWRKQTIIDAGGWQHDTLTEDLDLSYRAQLKGWEFKYMEQIGTPSELPVTIDALKSQQFRWTKGAAECLRKNLWSVLKDKSIPFATKFHATFHLMNSFIFISILMTALISLPLLFLKHEVGGYEWFYKASFFAQYVILFIALFYFISLTHKIKSIPRRIVYFLTTFPFFLAVSMGLSIHNTIAVVEGYLGKKTPFIRTPKFNITSNKDSWVGNVYISNKISWLTILEGIMAVYFIVGMYISFSYNDTGLVGYYSLLIFGFGYIFMQAFKRH